jgi:hypothetical protein
MDQNIQKNYALYIQISKSTTSQTIHKNLLEIIQKFCLPFTKQIKDFENFTFKSTQRKNKIKCCSVLTVKWLLSISLFIINHHIL